jgi:hypothetical protein
MCNEVVILILLTWFNASCLEWNYVLSNSWENDESSSEPEINVNKVSEAVEHIGDSQERWNRQLIHQEGEVYLEQSLTTSYGRRQNVIEHIRDNSSY